MITQSNQNRKPTNNRPTNQKKTSNQPVKQQSKPTELSDIKQ